MRIIKRLKENNFLIFLFRKYKRLKIRYFYGLKFVHPTFNIGGSCNLSADLIAGEYSYIGAGSVIYPGVSIGKYSMLAPNVQIIGGDHRFDKVGVPIIFSGREELRKTFIGRDVWIGSNSIIMTGVKIGDGCIVAAGSVVTKNIKPFSIVGGVPAKFLKPRFEDFSQIKNHILMLDGETLKYSRIEPLKN